ncbi:glucoamylase family protein [Tamlana sp. 2201CG12-4]|uniref:glucoamylase family protein n=1 Tax=Tamlana sp. 2201CG12-4 TaxID=3112582 RepID=UPI003FA3D841
MKAYKYNVITFFIAVICLGCAHKIVAGESGAKDKKVKLSDEELLEKVQKQTFKYFWDFAESNTGMAHERSTSKKGRKQRVTSGGTGLGLAAFPIAVERGWKTRAQVLTRLEKMLSFLENTDTFHGAYAHWYSGTSKRAVRFSKHDDGGDIIETAFLIEGLLINRQYFNKDTKREQNLRNRINKIWDAVEWDWYVQPGDDILTWHWSPNYGFQKNHKIKGHHEGQIAYILAASSNTHSIPASVYHNGWAQKGSIVKDRNHYGYDLPLGPKFGGPLFFTHYSYLGLNPKLLEDKYANYWTQNVNHSKINYTYCVENPKGYKGYGENCWGLTASDGNNGYSAHSPTNDRGVITPTAALSSFPYTPKESMKALRFFYEELGDKIWGDYGFTDAFNLQENWYDYQYLAIDQAPIIVMIENHRTGLIWDLFMSCPEINKGLEKLGFAKL